MIKAIIIIAALLSISILEIIHDARMEAAKRRRKAPPRRRGKTPERKQPDERTTALKIAREHKIIAGLIVQSDRLTIQIAQAEKRGTGLAEALTAKQDAINHEIEIRSKYIKELEQ